MAITIALTDGSSVETYSGLLSFVTTHLELDAEAVAQLPLLLRTAEYRINRLVLAPERETSATLTTTASVDYVALPTGFRQMRAARYVAAAGYPLMQVNLETLRNSYGQTSGAPEVYAIANQSIYFGPTPAAAYGVEIVYIEKIPQLSASNETNWLLADHADIYIYALLSQACAFRDDMEAATVWDGLLLTTIEELNAAGNRYRAAGPLVMRRAVIA